MGSSRRITRAEAYQRITELADRGDPAVIAATRQTWVRRADVGSEEAPVRRLYVLERTDTGVFVAYVDPDAAADLQHYGYACALPDKDLELNDHSEGGEFGVDLLELYELEAWEPFEFLLPPVGALDNEGERKS
jgi:hypothetical protein